MKKEKRIAILTYVLVLLSIIILLVIYFCNKNSTTTYTPDYITKVFDKNSVIEINIEISEENLNSMFENPLDEEYVVADITINGETIYNVGIRPKGNSSLSQVASSDSDRYSFKIKFDEYVSGQSLYGLDKMVLNNMIGDATYLKEYMSYEIMDYIGVNTPAYAFANIKINGEDWGLYLAIEVLEEDFLERYYGKDYGNLYKPESDNQVGGGGGGGGGAPAGGGGNPGGNNQGGMPGDDAGGQADNLNSSPAPTDDNDIDNTNDLQDTETLNATTVSDTTEDTSNTENAETSQNANQPNAGGGGDDPGAMNGGGGMNSSTTQQTSLLYIDDNIESYSAIFDSVVTKGLTDADKYNYIKMVKALSTGEDIEKYVDVEEVLRYFAANTFLVNLDSYAGTMKHNYYLYEEDGVFQILPWDFNLSFGTFRVKDASKVINFPIDEPVTDTMENSPLISSLLNVDEYKELYHEYLQEIVDYVTSGQYADTINAMNDLIYSYVANDQTAFYTLEEYEAGVENLLIYGEDRAKSVYLQLIGEQPSTEYGDVETTLNLSALGEQGGGDGDGNGGGGGGMNPQAENTDTADPANAQEMTDGAAENTSPASDTGDMPADGNEPTGDAGGDMPADGDTPTGDAGGDMPADGNAPAGDAGGDMPADGNAPTGDAGGDMPADGNAPTGDAGDEQNDTMPAMGAQSQGGNSPGGGGMNNGEGGGMNTPPGQGTGMTSQNIKTELLYFLPYVIVLFIGLGYVFVYKRKKYYLK